MAAKSDISFHLDETWDYEVEVRDAADAPITNIAAAEWRIASKASRVVYAELGDGITVVSPGKVLIRVPRARQSTITASGRYEHELWVFDGTIESIQVAGAIEIRNSLKRQFP